MYYMLQQMCNTRFTHLHEEQFTTGYINTEINWMYPCSRYWMRTHWTFYLLQNDVSSHYGLIRTSLVINNIKIYTDN